MHWKNLYLTCWKDGMTPTVLDHVTNTNNEQQPHSSNRASCWTKQCTAFKGRPKQQSSVNQNIGKKIHFQAIESKHSKQSGNLPSCIHPDLNYIDYNTPTLIKSQRDADHLAYQGYRYRLRRRKKNGGIVWICVQTNCKGNLVTDKDYKLISLSKTNLHNHDSNPNKINSIHLINYVKVLEVIVVQ